MYPQQGGNEPQQPFGYPVQHPAQPPPSIRHAVIVMYVGGALAILGFILVLIRGSSGSSSAGAPGLATVAPLIDAGLWFWMASANKSGKNWARITSTVFFGLERLPEVLQRSPTRFRAQTASSPPC